MSKMKQDNLIIINRSGIVGKPLYLATVGGSGSGKVTFTIISAGTAKPIVSNNKLISKNQGSCIVKATKEGDNKYDAISSNDTTVVFSLAQASVSPCCSNFSRVNQNTSFGCSINDLIIEHPKSQSVKAGSIVTFSIIDQASASITYQWYKNTPQTKRDVPITGENLPMLKINNVSKNDEGDYYVILKSLNGQVVMSNFAKLTVI